MKPVSDDVFAEAVRWHARLRETLCDPVQNKKMHAALEHWLTLDSEHKAALQEVELLWGKLELPAKRMLAGSGDARPLLHAAVDQKAGLQRRRWFYAGGVFAVAATLFLMVGMNQSVKNEITRLMNDNVVSSEHEILSQSLPDGSVLRLNAQTSVEIDFSPEQRTVRLIDGQAWFNVASDKARPFVVKTDLGSITALGTQFDVDQRGDTVTVSLVEGRVSVEDARQPSRDQLQLSAGYAVSLSAKGMDQPHRFDMDTVSAWRSGQVIFYRTPLSEVLQSIAPYSDRHIFVVQPGLANLTVSGVFSISDIDQVLKVIEQTLPVRVVEVGGYVVFLI